MLRFSEPPQVSEIQDLNLYELRELIRIRHRLIEKQTVCKVQLVRNIDTVWPDYGSVMKRVLGTASIAILKKYSVPSKVRAKSFEQFYELVKKTKRSEGKHHYSALNAVAAKLLRIVYWVLKNNYMQVWMIE